MKKSHIWKILSLPCMLSIAWLCGCPSPGGGPETPPPPPPTYTVTYDGNGSTGGTALTDPTQYTEGQTAAVLGNTGSLEKPGNSFTGWNTKADGSGTTYGQGQKLPIGTSSVILYAQWTTLPTFTVTYESNGASSGTVPLDTTHYLSGQPVTVLGNSGNLSKPGFGLSGWNTRADGNGTTYAPNSTFVMGSSSITLYAMWASAYTVTYNANTTGTTGNVPIDPNYYLPAATVTVMGAGYLAKAGYTLTGWNTMHDGSGTTYSAQNPAFIMGNSSVTLYGIWAQVFTVIYDGNGSTGGNPPTDSGKYLLNATVMILGNTNGLTKSYYGFTGWNTHSDGSGTAYIAGQAFAITANVTLYAQWIELTVTYGGNGSTSGNVPVDSGQHLSGWPVTVLGNTGNLTKTGFSFIGWNTQANGAGTRYMPGQTFNMGSTPVTLYAMWTSLPTYTVIYDGNGATSGSPPVDPNNYLPGDRVTVLYLNTLAKAGSSYVGWNTQADWSGANYYQQQTFTMGAANLTLYVVWCVNGLNILPVDGTLKSYYVAANTIGGSIRIPPYVYGAPVVSIANYSFNNDTGLTGLAIPNTVTSIGTYAFSGCTGLTSFTIPDSVTSIGSRAFQGCTNLSAVTIGSGISVLDVTFFGCTSLNNVVIPSGVTTVNGAFIYCTSLTSIVIPENVTSLVSAFEGCTSLANVTIPSKVTDISYAFSYCTALTTITIPNNVSNIFQAFYHCTGLSSVILPASITTVSDGAFDGCVNLSSVTIPITVTSIGQYAFHGCAKLSSITIPSSVGRIGFDAFMGCSALTTVTIPSSVSRIDQQAFANCTGLTEVVINATTPPTSDFGGMFAGSSNLTAIRVPPGSVTAYQEAQYWHDYAYLIVSQ